MKKEERDKRREEWGSLLKEWKNSGLTQIEYCRRNNLKVTQLLYWNRKLSDKKSISSFVQVPILPTGRTYPIRIEIGNRFGVELGHGYDPTALEHIIGILSRT